VELMGEVELKGEEVQLDSADQDKLVLYKESLSPPGLCSEG
jgi:hypothetical protein